MIDTLLIHTATVQRPGHTVSGGKKTPSESTVASGVRCLLQPVGTTVAGGPLGILSSDSWVGFFAAGTDLQVRDEVLWTDRTPSLVFTVEGIEPYHEHDPSADHHLQAALKRKRAG